MAVFSQIMAPFIPLFATEVRGGPHSTLQPRGEEGGSGFAIIATRGGGGVLGFATLHFYKQQMVGWGYLLADLRLTYVVHLLMAKIT